MAKRLSPEEREARKKKLVDFTASQEDMLAKLKGMGISRNTAVKFGIAAIYWFTNRAGWDTTQEAVFPYLTLKSLREHLRQLGASPDEMANCEKLIIEYETVLKRLEKEGDKPGA